MSDEKEVKQVEKKEEKKVEKPKVWVFRSKTDFKLCLIPKRQEIITLPNGQVHTVNKPGISILFRACRFVVNDMTAKALGFDRDSLAMMMISDPRCGKQYQYVSGPDKEPTEADIAYEIESNQLSDSRVKVTQGARTTNSKVRK